ncbi:MULTISPECIES: SGNH/GDSL hydrolase family protein [unclassified Streptomyces]|uniref:SGNH/GDSL hydrolase family protein n=1 Tax=Streptomyces salyersiae TaxID=3075530 RepID=A0ABU2RCH4_9ACTN|nr:MULTISPECIES: SGNH/GDSL hydrolase family protein [unclassified Streptomyces]AEN10254.1 lipolytic protein G-D-S-L family [Streptomyces sp. SirexAA-E]MDT0426165.1 SGNH/GDSL hydrolase family protein [Streptomyces sp. DSM 41770]MYR66894.1 SGNH/GDSL hydrolase family protein [Streptomyces sp. SID4939]MYR98875.1 SGNH/GDSL hydrolase family protein [Streptomyces sp. SID4940]MYT65405.1 SGNH/GDSL hydrolase family protein [Streptomyces sp. SID8357]
MSRRQGHALLIALVAGTAALAAVLALGTSLVSSTRRAPLAEAQAQPAARHPAAPAHSSGSWVVTWTGAPAAPEPDTADGYPGRTFRNTVHTSIGGDAARITLSNLFGTTPLVIDQATVATRPVTFAGRGTVTVAAGGQVVSDPVTVPVAPDADLLVTLRTPYGGQPVTQHPNAHQTSYLADGRRTWATTAWRYLTAVDVRTDTASGAIVVLGDSLTAGANSSTDTNSRWPDVLSDRLRHRYGIANQGIAGNRVLRDSTSRTGAGGMSGLHRFDRDVLSVAGARTVIVALGINDVQQAPQETDPQRIVAALRTLTERAHARGLRVVGATLTPFRGYPTWTPARNDVRLAVNAQIRAGRVFDDFVDFDRAVRDPYAPDRILPAYDAGDRLHFNDTGYRVLGRLVDPATVTGASTADAL